MADIVIATNESDRDFHGRFNSVPFIIPAGGDAFIDREAAVLWFGDWTLRNIGHEDRTQFRLAELNRLKGLYGAGYDDPREDPRVPSPRNAAEKWAANQPKVKLREADGTAIPTVIEDPSGETLSLEDAPQNDLARALSSMQAQMDALKAQMAENVIPTDVPVDDPGSAAKRRRGPVSMEPSREEAG